MLAAFMPIRRRETKLGRKEREGRGNNEGRGEKGRRRGGAEGKREGDEEEDEEEKKGTARGDTYVLRGGRLTIRISTTPCDVKPPVYIANALPGARGVR